MHLKRGFAYPVYLLHNVGSGSVKLLQNITSNSINDAYLLIHILLSESNFTSKPVYNVSIDTLTSTMLQVHVHVCIVCAMFVCLCVCVWGGGGRGLGVRILAWALLL